MSAQCRPHRVAATAALDSCCTTTSCHGGGTHKPGSPTRIHQLHMCQTIALWHIRRMAPSEWQTQCWPPHGPSAVPSLFLQTTHRVAIFNYVGRV
ncbi:hypothetical protein [Rock bream iridovirus]|uniref:ORF100R n=3 Tax=Infectious spleen and kidney necrosis virus TaxID=180170 RepID=Q5YEY7_ISKNV|nr:ORF100R [Rock bream iridovirus]AAX82414.1 ORF105R [Orange-spotted grouper iridovirus]AGG37983.1 hypothetical protein [Rock bream iridovirus]AMM72738.1 ORF117R [giant sea perch iridovirus - K1]